MVGGTSFHRRILKASRGRMSKSNDNNKSNTKSFLISKKTGVREQHNTAAYLGHSTCLLTTPTRLSRVGGTSFHRRILKASRGRMSKSNNNNKSNTKSFLISKKTGVREQHNTAAYLGHS